MAQVLYINPDPATQARATTLGCGWMPTVPAQFANRATAPCVILNGAGITTVISDTPPVTPAAVATALAPILTAETNAATAQAVLTANQATLLSKAQAALAANATYQAITTPTTAQNTAQIQLMTKELNALIRLAINLSDSTAGT